ncbi:MAG: ComEC/Rec2 family competence protein [Planctomycetia bacterium]|nr:ComEC/Rec2 family competence protein [Planctomycetia bacterium]
MRSAPATPLHYQPLLLVLAAVALGVCADRLWAIPPIVSWGCGAMLGAVWLVAWAWKFERVASVLLLVASGATAAAWHHDHWNYCAADDVATVAGEEAGPAAVKVVARSGSRRVAATPYDPLRAMQRGEQTRLEVEFTAIRDVADWRTISGDTSLLVEGPLPDIAAGDELLVFGQLGRIRPAGNPGEIDFAAHARSDRRRVFLRADFADSVKVLSRGSAWDVRAWLDEVRRKGNEQLWRHIDPERSGFAAALLLGDRGQLEASRSEAFFHTATIHFLAISGLHVAILAGALFVGLRAGLLPRGAALLCVAGATVLYTLLTDSPPSAVRAMVLVLMVCLAMYAGRPASAFNGLGAAGLIVLVLNPADLFRAGTQLSFLAVAALAFMGPHFARWQEMDTLDRLVARTRPWPAKAARWCARWLWRTTATTTIVWLCVLPLTVAHFHVVSPVAILVSPIISAPIAVALLSGFAVMLLGPISPVLATPFAWVCNSCLWFTDWAVDVAASVPGSHFWVAGPGWGWTIALYVGLVAWAALPVMRVPAWRGVALLAAWAVASYGWSSLVNRPDDKLECTFLSVGHGCSVVVRFPDGKVLLYDAGRLGSPEGAARAAASYLWHCGITRIDSVVISHADLDHYNGVPKLLSQFSVGEVYVSPQMFARYSRPLALLAGAISEQGVRRPLTWSGQELPIAEGCRALVLHPPREGSPGTDNANSIVLLIEYQEKRILLTGDLETPGLEKLLKSEAIDCDVILAPHHGSARSDAPGLAAWSKPEWVVISGARASDSRGVAAAYTKAGARVLHTAEDGAATFLIDGEGVTARTHLRGQLGHR